MARTMTVADALKDPTTKLGQAAIAQTKRNEILARMDESQLKRYFQSCMKGNAAQAEMLAEIQKEL